MYCFKRKIKEPRRFHTKSKNLTPAHGIPAYTGEAFTATSATVLNLSSQRTTLSTMSRGWTLRPLKLKLHLLSSHSFCFALAASTRASGAMLAIADVDVAGTYSRIISLSLSERRCLASSHRSLLGVLAGDKERVEFVLGSPTVASIEEGPFEAGSGDRGCEPWGMSR